MYVGLVGFGVSLALMVRARLGLGPWDVLHQGLAGRLHVPIGWVVIGVGAVVLLAWIPLRERPGIGTVSNAVVVGLVVDGALAVLPAPGSLAVRATFLAVGIAGNAVATALYIGAGLGPGPRDGLMTGLASARPVRPGGAHGVGAGRAGDRVRARRVGRGRDGGVRVGDRTAGAVGAAPAHSDRCPGRRTV